MMKTNYHTHTFYCGHAVGTVEENVIEAIEKGYSEIGFSEHSYIPGKQSFLTAETYPLYIEDCKKAKEKYKNQILVLIGEEMDFFPDQIEFYKKMKKELDFMGLSIHFYDHMDSDFYNYSSFFVKTMDDIKKYQKLAIEGIRTNLFDFVCHPDLFLYRWPEWNSEIENVLRSIIEEAMKYNIPLEINCGGLRRERIQTSKGPRFPYCREEYLELLEEYQAPVIIGSDNHDPKKLDDEFMELARNFVKQYHLNLVEKLPRMKAL